MNFKLLFVTAIIFICCNRRNTSTVTKSSPSNYEQVLEAKEGIKPDPDSIGTLIAKIEFKLKATKEELDIFDDGIVPWISLQSPNEEIPRLIDADEIILPYSKVTLIIDYPLNKPASFEISAQGSGFTKTQLIREISKKYHQIYQDEEESASIKTIPLEKRKGLINRNETNGKYGVWGHDLADLDLSVVEVYKNREGKIYLTLSVES
jgi:hypothetical protein